jgi:hypothetical protein
MLLQVIYKVKLPGSDEEVELEDQHFQYVCTSLVYCGTHGSRCSFLTPSHRNGELMLSYLSQYTLNNLNPPMAGAKRLHEELQSDSESIPPSKKHTGADANEGCIPSNDCLDGR